MFEEVDKIVKLGKWAYYQIPLGGSCKGCPLLGSYEEHWYCSLRPATRLLHDAEVPLKGTSCPIPKE